MKKTLSLVLAVTAVFFLGSCQHSGIEPEEAKAAAEADSVYSSITDIDRLESLRDSLLLKDDRMRLTLVYKQLGRCYRNNSQFEAALRTHREGLTCASGRNDTVEMVRAYNHIGTDFRRLGMTEEAAENHYMALELCDKFSDKLSYAARKNRVTSLNGLGNMFLSLKELQLADSLFRMALKVEKELDSHMGQAINYSNLGAIFEEKNQLDSARLYYQLSMAHNREIKSELGVSLCHINFGRLYEKQNQWDMAEKEYLNAYNLMKGSNDRWHWLESVTPLAHINILLGQYAEAQRYIDEGDKTAIEIGSLPHQAAMNRMRYLMYERQARYPEALAALKLSQQINDSVNSPQKLLETQNFRVRYIDEHYKGEIKNLEDTNREEKRYMWFFLVGIGLMLLLATVALVMLINSLWVRSRNLKLEKKLERARSDFYQNLTHEFRTPLTVVISTGEQLLSEPQPKPSTLASMGEALCRQGERMLNLVNQLLDIAKIRSEMQQEDWRHGDIVAYMKMLVSSFQPQAEKCQVELRYSPAESRVDMDFVPDYMIKVFSNLISNAFKYTPSHGHVYISSHVENEHIQFQVADNGMGISEEDIEQIFNEFYQGSEGPLTIGTGIGLALVKSIITTVGGEIQVESPQRKGTIFTLSFPLRHGSEKLKQLDSDLISKDVLHPKTSEDKFGEIEGSPENAPIVLIIDDEPDVSYYIGLQLKNHYRLYYAKDGQEGIEKAKEILPDLIITDLLMPRMDGFELCRAVRSSELLDHIAVVVLSARGGDEDRIKAMAEGADAFLGKPFKTEELRTLVARLLENRNMLRQRYSQALLTGKTDEVPISQTDAEFMRKLVSEIETQMGRGEVSVQLMANNLFISRSQLTRKVQLITGMNTSEYVMRIRMNKARRLLEEGRMNISEVATCCGFTDQSYFTRMFKKTYNLTPSQVKKITV